MAPQILTIHQALEVAHDEWFFTQAATAADPHAAKFSAGFESLISKQWQPVVDQERVLRRNTLSSLALCSMPAPKRKTSVSWASARPCRQDQLTPPSHSRDAGHPGP